MSAGNTKIIESEYETFEDSDVNLQSTLLNVEDNSFSIMIGEDAEPINFVWENGIWTVAYEGSNDFSLKVVEDFSVNLKVNFQE